MSGGRERLSSGRTRGSQYSSIFKSRAFRSTRKKRKTRSRRGRYYQIPAMEGSGISTIFW
jgi:hypothetical protein